MWAWDKETNVRVFAEDSFKKLIYRKKEGWITPDERDLRELTNRRAAILKRNCLLELIPKDFIEDAMATCKTTLQSVAEQDPDGARKRLIVAFAELNITPEMLEHKLAHPLVQTSPAELAELRKVYASIRDGNSTWAEYVGEATDKPEVETGSLSMDDLSPVPPESEPQPPPEPETPPDTGQLDITDDQYIVIKDLAGELGVKFGAIQEFMMRNLGYPKTKVSTLKQKDYAAVLEFINDQANPRARE